MTTQLSTTITPLLAAAGRGDDAARRRLWATVYDALHDMARHQLAAESPGRHLGATSLVHEVYLRLLDEDDNRVCWNNRRHFFAAAAQAMRRIRVDDARKRKRQKRGGGKSPEGLGKGPAVFDRDPAAVLTLNEALDRLSEESPRRGELVSLRYFAGLSIDQCAEVLGVSPRTIDSDWRLARAWLHRQLSKGDSAIG